MKALQIIKSLGTQKQLTETQKLICSFYDQFEMVVIEGDANSIFEAGVKELQKLGFVESPEVISDNYYTKLIDGDTYIIISREQDSNVVEFSIGSERELEELEEDEDIEDEDY